MYKYFLFCFLIINQYSCSKDLLMNCNSNNYFTSSFHNMDNGFSNSQREVSTKLSEEDLDSMFSDSGLSCKEVLSQYFYCNICFNNNEEYISKNSAKKNEIACGVMFRKECLFDIGLYNPKFKMREGHEIKKRFEKKHNLGYLNLPLYKYRFHEKNRTKNTKILKKYDRKLKS